jgi:predicted O-methyltransferase YrrM
MGNRASWLKMIAEDPLGALGRLRGEWDRRQDRQAWKRIGRTPRDFYRASSDAEQKLHALLGMPWPCPEHAASSNILRQMNDQLARSEEIAAKKSAESSRLKLFDADVSLSRVAWCVTRHLVPVNVVETGVARGVTSRFLLEALELNGAGNLWSIDLPHATTSGLGQIGSAVPNNLRGKWHLLLGPSRRHLPRILKTLGQVDLFVHDSLHTSRNVLFELDLVWDRIKPGGVILIDDVNENLALHSFIDAVGSNQWVVGHRSIGGGLWGAVVKDHRQVRK